MIIKQADDKTRDLEMLKSMAARPDVSAGVRTKIKQEIKNIQSGMKGEADAAYEMGFHFRASKNWMVLHDLRLKCEERVVQIDHLLINRFMEIYVCESKRFSEGIAINEQGEFSAFYDSKPRAIASPIEQNRRHIAVLEAVFKTGQVALPTRLGFNLKPALKSLILVSTTSRITRPKTKVEGVEQVIKNDQLHTHIYKAIDADNNPILAVKLIGQDTLEAFARSLAAAHQPLEINWAAKFGVPGNPLQSEISVRGSRELTNPESASATTNKSSKLSCASCGVAVTYTVAKFCWSNKRRFDGKVFCMECQKQPENLLPKSTAAAASPALQAG